MDGYDNAKLGAARSLVRAQAGTMPQGAPLAADRVKILADWITNGMPKDDVGAVPPLMDPVPTPGVTPAVNTGSAASAVNCDGSVK